MWSVKVSINVSKDKLYLHVQQIQRERKPFAPASRAPIWMALGCEFLDCPWRVHSCWCICFILLGMEETKGKGGFLQIWLNIENYLWLKYHGFCYFPAVGSHTLLPFWALLDSNWVTNKPWKPWKTQDFLCPWKNTLENPEITSHPWKLMFWSRFSVHQFLALQCCCIFYSCNSGEEDLWGCLGVKTACHLSCGKQPLSNNRHKISSKRKMKGGWVQAEDLYVIIIFFENMVKRTLENL